ncbi:hypothetical protein HMPREF1207_03543 [Paenibacillus sp. HGH0039]|nr:hypothetical protein HMPREF1207_03543 [Paenibacillus sp. HGH0039]
MKTVAAREHWHDFFGKDYLLFSEVILNEERTRFEIGQLLSLLNLPEGASILDLGCGQGRISVPLALRGYQVTGIDASDTLLDEARRRALASRAEAVFKSLDMRELDFADEFDAVLNLGTAFGYLENEEENQDILHRVYRALKPGGQLIQETENRDFKLLYSAKKTWDMMNGCPVWSQREFDSVTGRWNEEMTWFDNGELKSSRLNLRLYTAAELLHLHGNAGLDVKGIYGGFDLSPLTTSSPRMLLHLEKKTD